MPPYDQLPPHPAHTKIAYIDGQPTTLHLRKTRLVVNPGGKNERIYSFDQDIITLGATDTCDVFLDDETVSRRHCRIIQDGPNTLVVDLNSTNGTWVEGVRVGEAYLEPDVLLGWGIASSALIRSTSRCPSPRPPRSAWAISSAKA